MDSVLLDTVSDSFLSDRFDISQILSVSLAMQNQNLVVSLTPVKDSFTSVIDTVELLTPVKHSKTKEAPLTCVVYTGEKFLTGVNNSGNAYTEIMEYSSMVSMTLAKLTPK
jgi:hypothetical protein